MPRPHQSRLSARARNQGAEGHGARRRSDSEQNAAEAILDLRVIDADPVLERPRHPYTAGLLAAIPRAGVAAIDLRSIPGRVPPPSEFPRGCRFAPRCAFRQAHGELELEGAGVS